MSIESLVFFFVLLFLSLLALAIRWLNERIRRDIAFRDLKDLFGPSEDSRDPDREVSERTKPSLTPSTIPSLRSRPAISPERRSRNVPRLRNRTDLRQGIIIMTILGPCRGLETQREDFSSLRH